MRTTIFILLFLTVSSTWAQETPPPTATRWECSAALASNYNERILMSMKGDLSSETQGIPWQVAVGRRTGERWVLSAQYERMVVRHGQGVNDELLESDYYWSLFGDYYLNTYRTDLLTTEQAMSTVALQAAYLLRPYRMRRTFGLAVRGEAALRFHRISAEQGVLSDHINSSMEEALFGIGFYNDREAGSIALDMWNMRTVVNTAHGNGLSLALGMRMDLHCTRHFSLFNSVGMNLCLAKPRFDGYAVPDTDVEFAAYSVDLTALRFGIGAAVHF